eukprot:IDg5492t1
MDVITAFLNGSLKQLIYMEQPVGFENKKHPEYVCKLQKSIYGLKQASREWHEAIDAFLMSKMDFKTSPHDLCPYVRKYSNSLVIITLYVDDLLIASNSLKAIGSIKIKFSSRFKMKDCGKAAVCLGLEIYNNPSRKTVFINQERYAEKVLERFGMLTSKPVVTPMEKQITIENTQGEKIDSTLYRQAIGSLMYLSTGTRPDIAFAVGRLAKHVENPTKDLWVLVKRVLRYISGTRNFGIMIDGILPLFPAGYTDSDWGGCLTSRKSTSGFAFLMSGGAVSWKAKKQ